MDNLSIPKGTRDFSPTEMVRRNYIFNKIRSVFERYGYLPIETPSMENLSTLLGKYGEEGDRLIFKILNSGNYLENVDLSKISQSRPGELTSLISEKALRYDLTVPFARYVVQHFNEITFPFKRYQIQPVWRADKPQKGRYREFFQCDVDVIGSNSLLNEVELAQIINDVFNELQLKIRINLNNRKILSGIATYVGAPDKFIDLTVAIDKLEKIGMENVMSELSSKGFSEDSLQKIKIILDIEGNELDKIRKLEQLLQGTSAEEGLREMESIFLKISQLPFTAECHFDLALARGLNYYTGTIFEVKSLEVQIGSICGGGRYDDLTGIFGLQGMSGVGVSFGADRIYDVMLALDRFPGNNTSTTKVLFINFGKTEEDHCLSLVTQFRAAGINSELYPDQGKLKKQMKYADQKQIPFVILIGENEIKEGTVTVKNMISGEQISLSANDAINYIKNNS
jgi:histidyl-tRNA synthetase